MTDDRDDVGPLRLVLAVAFVLLLVGGGLYVLYVAALSASVSPKVDGATEAPTTRGATGAELRLEGGDPPIGAVEHASSDRRTAVEGSATRTWRDLLAPVDALDGSALDGAVVLLVDESLELRTRALDDAIEDGDLAKDVVAALDDDAHLPRAFLPSALADHEGAPQRVELWPSATLAVELAEPRPGGAPAPRVVVRCGNGRR
ncbi:MAG: hypothetical protein R3F34_21050 [Planctomycetota bacterium]